jgi:hypothetical protein
VYKSFSHSYCFTICHNINVFQGKLISFRNSNDVILSKHNKVSFINSYIFAFVKSFSICLYDSLFYSFSIC